MASLLQASPALGLLALALVIAAIVAMHRIRPRPVPRTVPSTLVWQAALRRRGRRPAIWRWWLGLALSLTIGVLLTLVLVRPELRIAGGSERTVVIVDNSRTLAVRTHDGQTRWAHALALARSIVGAAAGPVLVLDTQGRSGTSGFVGRAEAMAALERMTVAPVGEAAPLPALPPGAEVHFVGDGVAAYELPRNAIVHSVFEPADNVAVVRLVTRPLPTDPLRVEAFVEVLNASPGAKDVRLTLRDSAGHALTQDLQIAAGERIAATFDVSTFEGVLAAAALAPGDAFPLDDIAYAVLQPHRTRRIQLVTGGNATLADALAALPGVRLEVMAPSRYRHGARADGYVFDGFAPPHAPDAGALLFRPSVADWLPAGKPTQGAIAIDGWDRGSPLAAGIPWNTVGIRRGELWPPRAGDVALVRAGSDAVVLSGRTGVPWIVVGFLTGDSDLPLQPGFTVFLGNALAQLAAGGTVRTEPLGPIRVPIADAQVRDGQGRVVPSQSVAGDTLFEAQRPDVYTARAGAARMRVVASLMDARLAQVNASRFAAAPSGAGVSVALPLDRWVLAALACLALLLFDWGAYARRLSR